MHETEWVSLPVLQQTWWVYMAVPQFFSSYCFDAFAISLPKKDLVFCKPAYCHIIYFVFLFIAFFERNIGHNRCIVLQTEIALYTIFTAYAYYIIYWSKRLWTHFWNKVLLFSNELHNSSNMTLNSILFTTFNTHALSSSTGPSSIMNVCVLPCSMDTPALDSKYIHLCL